MMYVAEGAMRPEFESIPLAMVWSAKVIMGGVPQHMPATVWGELVTIGTRFFGLLLFGLMISIMGNTLKKILFGEGGGS